MKKQRFKYFVLQSKDVENVINKYIENNNIIIDDYNWCPIEDDGKIWITIGFTYYENKQA